MSTVQEKPVSSYLLRRALEDVLDCPVDLEPAPPVATSVSTCSAAIYVSSPLVTRGVIVTDLALAASLGAAFVRVPTRVVDEAVSSRSLPTVVESGLREAFGELAVLFAAGDSPGRLYQCVGPGDPVPVDVIALAARPGRRLDVRVRPHGYRGGLLSLLPA